MSDIAAVLVTVDRSPGQNYLAETLANLARSDLFTSERLHSLNVLDSKAGNWAYDEVAQAWPDGDCSLASVFSREEDAVANVNVADALLVGHTTGATWVLFLEDDIDVCAQFFDSVGAWLDDHAKPAYQVYAFGAAYQDVATNAEQGLSSWEYPVHAYYGTQCFAVRRGDALSLADYIRSHLYDKELDGTAWDLLMHDWAGLDQLFLASCPSFVQHVGTSSVIRPRDNVHTFDSWPGREWHYEVKTCQD